MSTALDANEVRKDFEIAVVFGLNGIAPMVGCLKRRLDGRYEDPAIDGAWHGYLTRAAEQHARDDCLRATRFIGNADRTAVRNIINGYAYGGAPSIDDLIRAILKHFEGMPT